MKTHHSRFIIALVAIFLSLGAPRSVRANTYQWDDGTAEDSIGLNNGGDLIALNHFTVSGNNDMIMSVSIAWGNTGSVPDPSLNGLTYTAVIWNDTVGTGNPANASFLTSVSGNVISNANTDTFNVTIFPTCPMVTRSFFVGFIITQGANQFPAALDFDSPTFSNESFLAASITPGGGDITNLSNNDFPVNAVENYGFTGNWLIRADACVPEPTTTSLIVVAGIAGLLGYRARSKKERVSSASI